LVDFDLADAVNILNRTPRVLNAQLRGLDRRWTDAEDRHDALNPRQTIKHLIDLEENFWLPALQSILHDRRPMPPDANIVMEHSPTINKLLDQFGMARRKNLRELADWRLTHEQLQVRGTIPEWGDTTVRQLISSWVAHDLSHLTHITRVLMEHYAAEISSQRLCNYHTMTS
jgi:hypothetical protein